MARLNIYVRPDGDGEWVAEAKDSKRKVIATAHGLSRQEAINRVKKEIPQPDRFEHSISEAKHSYGYVSVITDRKTGTRSISSNFNSGDAVINSEKGMPKQYFKEKYGEYSWKWHYTEANPIRGFLPYGIIIVAFIIICIIGLS